MNSNAPADVNKKLPWPVRAVLWALGLGVAGALSVAALLGVALATVYPNVPDISALQDYRPKLPLRIYSAEGALIGEFGEERRTMVPIEQMPQVMIDAVLAIEDARFYEHGGVDFVGILRAFFANIANFKSQGASTITMQVARNVYLSSEKTYTRKLYEILLTYKLENLLSKNKILEIYMNQIFLGHRAYGFASAANVYFGKKVEDLTVAEAAMLAGLPKAPSQFNPIVNPKRARVRQLHIIDRMLHHGFITAEQAAAARAEPLKLRSGLSSVAAAAGISSKPAGNTHAEFVAEMARQMVFAQYGADAYTRGLNVYTTLNLGEQEAAYAALRRGIMDYERRQRYRGPERFITLPADAAAREEAIEEALAQHPDNGDVLAAVVLAASPKELQVQRGDGEVITITGRGLQPVESGLSPKAAPSVAIRPGAIIRIIRTGWATTRPASKGEKPQQIPVWAATQLPEVEGAFIALDPRTGAIRALVGGFDFQKNKFNHVTQAWRQPGSTFKPFIYSAGLESGITPATIVNDAPLLFDRTVTGGAPWEPKNYDGQFDGPITLREALARSRNIPSIRVLQTVGPEQAQQWVSRFGFDADKHPAYLTMALGAGQVTPLQMAVGFSVFANGGHRINPWLIERITDDKGQPLHHYRPQPLKGQSPVISARNAFVINSMLQTVTSAGTAARAQSTLKRQDLYGKTGTTNDSMDAWFAGFHPTLAAVVWVGYDTPRKLGSRETGGGLSLPIWIEFMQHALADVPQAGYSAPAGLVRGPDGDWMYAEHASGGTAITGLGLDELSVTSDAALLPPTASDVSTGTAHTLAAPTRPDAQERRRILDLFGGGNDGDR